MSERKIANRKVTDKQIREALRDHGTKPGARVLGITPRTMQIRKRQIQERTGENMSSPLPPGNQAQHNYIEKGRIKLVLLNGVIVSASDCHYWPGEPPLMHRALLRLLPELRPDLFVLNGDVADFAKLSRFPDVEWSHKPTPRQELEVCQERLHEIVMKLKRGCRRIWTCGNHDSRWERYIIEKTGDDLKGIPGTSLKDWFPEWEPAWDVQVNAESHHPGDRITFQHNYSGGENAARNNAKKSGRTFVSGHLHSAEISAFTDLNGTRWGVDNGCVANPQHLAFSYAQNRPRNWREAFAVLTVRSGRLLPPELVTRWSDNEVVFRGEIIRV